MADKEFTQICKEILEFYSLFKEIKQIGNELGSKLDNAENLRELLQSLKQQISIDAQKLNYFEALIAKNEALLIKLSEILHFGVFFTHKNSKNELILTSTYENAKFDYNSHELHLDIDNLNITQNANKELVLHID